VLLHYFGEEFTEENCGRCDNCLTPRTPAAGEEMRVLKTAETKICHRENRNTYLWIAGWKARKNTSRQ